MADMYRTYTVLLRMKDRKNKSKNKILYLPYRLVTRIMSWITLSVDDWVGQDV